MKLSTAARVLVLGLSAVAVSAPASAEVTRTTDDSFVSRNEVVVEATPKEVWLALISPATWWQSAHTWSGDAKNLSLVPQAGGCFCETIPEVDEPGRFTLQGSVEHMRVVQAYPEAALRMVGGGCGKPVDGGQRSVMLADEPLAPVARHGGRRLGGNLAADIGKGRHAGGHQHASGGRGEDAALLGLALFAGVRSGHGCLL